ncbi:MAG: DedA family protein [Pararhizobium sp.]
MTATLAGFITAAISTLGYPGIALLMALESACIPIPSEIIMPFSGYLVSSGRFDLILVATAGAVGCNIGSTVAYVVGFYGGRPAIERWGRYVLLDTHELARVDGFFKRFGGATVLIGRLLPVVRTFISLPAGIARMPFWRFQIYTFVGSWPWCFALAYVGLRLGRAWDSSPRLKAIMHSLDGIVLVVIVAAVVWYVWRHWRKRAA